MDTKKWVSQADKSDKFVAKDCQLKDIRYYLQDTNKHDDLQVFKRRK